MSNWCECDLYIWGKDIATVLKATEGEEEIGDEYDLNSVETDPVGRVVRVLGKPRVRDLRSTPFDFNKIIPMPETLHVDSGTKSDLAVLCAKNEGLGDFAIYKWVKAAGYTTPAELCKHFNYDYVAMVHLGEQLLDNERKYGARTWYEWCQINWGTKWNASAVDDEIEIVGPARNGLSKRERAVVKFKTAWSPPIPVIRALSKMFPKHRFTLRYFESGAGFSGTFTVVAGKGADRKRKYKGKRGG